MSEILTSPVHVDPVTERPTHHISLTDGKITLGLIAVDSDGNPNPQAIARGTVPRTAMKTTSGNESYSSFEPPWSPIVQQDWSGGRGSLEFEKDTTSFMDDYQVNTLFGHIYLGPLEKFSRGYRKWDGHVPGSLKWSAIIPGSRSQLAYNIIPSSSYTIDNMMIWVKHRGKPVSDLVVTLCSSSAGHPSTTLQTAAISLVDIPDIVSRRYRVTIPAQALTAATNYWIKVSTSGGDDQNCWMVGVEDESGNTEESANGTTWIDSAVDLYCRVAEQPAVNYRTLFFQYKYAQYMIRQGGSGAPKLFINGDRGAADANTGALGKLNDATKVWPVGQWSGCMVKVFEGTGLSEENPVREIDYNGAGYLDCSPNWEAAHDTSTGYVILGSDLWTEIAGHGITVPVTDIWIVNDIVYFALGDDTPIRRMREYNNAGAWTREFQDDGTNKAYKLTTVRDQTNGLEIWRAQNKDATGKISVSKAPVIDWSGTSLTFAAAITPKDDMGKINSISEYGDSTKQLYIMREGTLGNITTGLKYDEIELREIRALMDFSNGKVVLRHNVYLYFNLGLRLERYYDRNLEDVGPNRNEGLPDDRNGTLSCGIGLPGMILLGVDGGTLGKYSSLLANNGASQTGGYCELFRSAMPGDRLWSMQYQVIPGEALDRIWIAVGDDILWLPYSVDRPRNGANSFTHEGVVVSGYIHAGYYDIYKFCHTLKLFAENLEKDICWVEPDYQIENDTEWKPMPEILDDSNDQTPLTDGIGINGKRIRIRLRVQSADEHKCPRVKSIVLDTISRVPLTYSYSLQYRVMDDDLNLMGEREVLTAMEKQRILDRWATQLTPLRMGCTRALFDNKVVFMDPSPASPRAEHLEKYIESLTLMQIMPEDGGEENV